MAYQNLRALMKSVAPPHETTLKNFNVVIDGKSFFRNSYKNSGCHSLLGGEYDRYADYLRHLLKPFLGKEVTCFVIFNGCMDADLEKRTEIHQNIVDRIEALNPEDENAYCEPILVKDVVKEILTELGIKYYVTENDHRRIMLSVALFFNCPLITTNYEYSLLYVSCVNPKSLMYDDKKHKLTCKMFDCKVSGKNFGIKHKLLPLFFTLLDEQGVCFKKLTMIVDCNRPKHLFREVLKWTRQQVDSLELVLEKIKDILTADEWTAFTKAYEANEDLCKNTKYGPVINHFIYPTNDKIRYDDRNWFRKAVGNGRLPVPYINLTKKGTFSGSWVIFDKEQDDAMMPALDIVFYVKRFLDIKLESKITFIGRQNDASSAREISKTWPDWAPKKSSDLFENFLYEVLPGFNMKLLEQIPKESWTLIVTSLYYCQKKRNVNFIYCVLLSFVMVGPVSNIVGVIKRSHFMTHDEMNTEENKLEGGNLKPQDCISAVENLMDLFYANRLKTLAEFQHCLQHMNYMNRLFGGTSTKNTMYHKTLNATFVYNMYTKLPDKGCAIKYFEKRLNNSSVFDYFKKLEIVFKTCLNCIETEQCCTNVLKEIK